MDHPEGFECARLEGDHHVLIGALPRSRVPDEEGFEALFALHPPDYHVIQMHGRAVETPRWQQAYGADYVYTGNTNRALEVPGSLLPLLAFSREHFHPRINGLLLNWYDARHAHYIGKHRDSTVNMISGAPIVTVSFGETRIFRMRPYRGRGYHDFTLENGSVLVIPYATNAHFTHEVPHFARYVARRLSVTLRAFETA